MVKVKFEFKYDITEELSRNTEEVLEKLDDNKAILFLKERWIENEEETLKQRKCVWELKGVNYGIWFYDSFIRESFRLLYNNKGERIEINYDEDLIIGIDELLENTWFIHTFLIIPKNEKVIKEIIKKMEELRNIIDNKYGINSFLKSRKIITFLQKGYFLFLTKENKENRKDLERLKFNKDIYIKNGKLYVKNEIKPLSFILNNLKVIEEEGIIYKENVSYNVEGDPITSVYILKYFLNNPIRGSCYLTNFKTNVR